MASYPVEPNAMGGTPTEQVYPQLYGGGALWVGGLTRHHTYHLMLQMKEQTEVAGFKAKQLARAAINAMFPEEMPSVDPEVLARCYGLLLWAIQFEFSERVETAPEPGLGPAFVQEFHGNVTSVIDGAIAIEFTTEDDREIREFALDELQQAGPVQVGQGVRVRCQLELLPPRGPLADAEVQEWEARHERTSGYLSKSKRSKPLLEEPDEEPDEGDE